VSDRAEESDLRRRAAWLLLMLGVVAVLFVIVLSTVLDSGGGGNNGSGPDDTLSASTHPSSARLSTPPSARGGSTTSSTASSSASAPATRDCPTTAPCALQGDFGNAITAINDYRVKNGKKPVPGTVSKAAQKCALSNGSNCSGGWAQSQVATLDGAAAVGKIAKLGKLLDPNMKSFGVGWAYSPQQHQYFFAIVRS